MSIPKLATPRRSDRSDCHDVPHTLCNEAAHKRRSVFGIRGSIRRQRFNGLSNANVGESECCERDNERERESERKSEKARERERESVCVNPTAPACRRDA